MGPNSLLFALVAGVLLCPLLAGCDDDGLGPGGNATISEPFDLQRDAAGRIAFRVVGINGGIAVTGVSQGESFQVTGFRRVQGCSLERAEALIEELEVRVSETAEEIVVQTLQPSSTSPCSLVVDYELEVPERLFGRISLVNGGVAVTGLHEGVSVTSVNGAAVLEDVEGDATVRLTNGAIEADVAIEGDEEIDLLTVNGTIDLTVPGGTHARL
ncbi:MAG TPA: hypothetical protein VLL48_13195, partial [Longimicrobiales bacterium]|nr:hypothetical protein [Longimicrobiales bacterium]